MKIEAYLGRESGTPAPGNTVPVNTPMAISQRDLNTKRVDEYICKHGGVNWDLFGYVKAMRLPNGGLVIIDGQHRINLVKRVLPRTECVPAHIVEGTAELAAKYFDDLNSGSTKTLNSEEKFWAKLQAGDAFAKMIADCVQHTDYALGKFNKQGNTVNLKYANTVKAIRMGKDHFLTACAVTHTVWPQQTGVDNLISGMTRLFQVYPELGNPELKIHHNFVQWLRDLKRTLNVKPKNLEFKKYRNNGAWYDAVAYGLARKYFQMIRERGHTTPPLNKIKEIWEQGARSDDDFESLI